MRAKAKRRSEEEWIALVANKLKQLRKEKGYLLLTMAWTGSSIGD